MQQLSQVAARRIALAAQGFTDTAHQTPTLRTLQRTVERTGVLQVDSVNVLQRAHYMPLYSRMGPYDPTLLARAASGRQLRRLVEYWAHVQAYMPVDLWPFMAHRRAAYRAKRGKWGFLDATASRPDLEAELLTAITDLGGATARELDDGKPRSKEHWGWNWSQARKMLDYLYLVGEVAIAGRNSSFEVIYDLPERVLPAVVLNAPTPTPGEAHRELVRRAARSHGVGTVRCLTDYYRMSTADTALAVAELVESGELEEVRIQGWARPAYRYVGARRPRRVAARSLLSPFDPVVWLRERAERLFDFHYRIEIYVPAGQRIYGYYVLPFLLGDQIVARVDLKADRATSRLLVKGAYAELHAPPDTGEQLAAELRRLADWLGLGEIVIEKRGDLSPGLLACLD